MFGAKNALNHTTFGKVKNEVGENSTHYIDLKVKNLQLKIEFCVLIVCALVVFLSYTF